MIVAELTLDVAHVVLDENFPERLQRVLSVPNRIYAQDVRSRRTDRASDFIVSMPSETLKPGELPMALTIWQSWRVKGSNGIQESSGPMREAVRIPTESLELFDGSRNCFLQLKAGVDRGNVTPGLALTVSLTNGRGYVTIEAPRDLLTSLEEDVRALMDDYVVHPQLGTVSAPRPFKVFIAYGGGGAWEGVTPQAVHASMEPPRCPLPRAGGWSADHYRRAAEAIAAQMLGDRAPLRVTR